MYNAYIYPGPASHKEKHNPAGSPYVGFLRRHLRNKFNLLNDKAPQKYGILDLLKYLARLDVVFFNWIENVPDKRGGYIQFLLLMICLKYLKKKKKKTVWIMHNKLSHEKKNLFLKQWVFKMMIKFSDLIVTHSREGIEYAQANFGADIRKIFFIHHPIMRNRIATEVSNKYDIIIWGKIAPYKGIDIFLKYLKSNQLDEKYRIYIAGEISPPEYYPDIMQFSNQHILIESRFLEENELNQRVAESKIILFTYNTESILSSGALMDSLVYDRIIIGPDSGAFRDLAEEGIIHTYSSFNELIILIDNLLEEKAKVWKNYREAFILQNTWENYIEKVHEWVTR